MQFAFDLPLKRNHFSSKGASTTSIAAETDTARRKQLMSQLKDFVLDESFVMVIVPNSAKGGGAGQRQGCGVHRP